MLRAELAPSVAQSLQLQGQGRAEPERVIGMVVVIIAGDRVDPVVFTCEAGEAAPQRGEQAGAGAVAEKVSSPALSLP